MSFALGKTRLPYVRIADVTAEPMDALAAIKLVIKPVYFFAATGMPTMTPLHQRTRMLFLALVVAAVVVILFSVIGIAIMTDLMPGIAAPEALVKSRTRP